MGQQFHSIRSLVYVQRRAGSNPVFGTTRLLLFLGRFIVQRLQERRKPRPFPLTEADTLKLQVQYRRGETRFGSSLPSPWC